MCIKRIISGKSCHVINLSAPRYCNYTEPQRMEIRSVMGNEIWFRSHTGICILVRAKRILSSSCESVKVNIPSKRCPGNTSFYATAFSINTTTVLLVLNIAVTRNAHAHHAICMSRFRTLVWPPYIFSISAVYFCMCIYLYIHAV